MKRILLLNMFLTLIIPVLAQQVIPLYDKVPGSKDTTYQETTESPNGIVLVSRVSRPTITVYRPEAGKANGTAIVICPGGGYSVLAFDWEGSDIAKVLIKWGITAVVLKYRLPDDAIMQDKSIGPLQDAQRALQLVRQHAAEWKLDPQRVGIMGFSAGGHLAATASTHFEEPKIPAAGISLRPDFSILIYPVISFSDSLMHRGSRDRLLGKQPDPARIAEYSNETKVKANTPPAFLVHAGDDKAVPAGNSIVYYQALLRNNVPAELHLYQAGGHGFSLNNKTTQDQWTERLANWLKQNKWL